ncbi:MAG: serine--tRNA ligase [Gammaproteobacteria bacterium]|nr:serine--tRNA ligase [Gammaproteobacteria bacterium]
MLDPRALRRDPELIAKALSKRGNAFDLTSYRELETTRHDLQTELENLQHERNEISKAIGQAKGDGLDIEPLKLSVREIGFRLDVVKQEFAKVRDELSAFLLSIPNVPHESVPAGEDEDDNLVLYERGEIPSFNFEAKDHVNLAPSFLDIELAAKISGSRFSVLRGPLAKLQRSLTQFMLDVHVEQHGYEEVYVPYIVNASSMTATGQLPKFAHDAFQVQHTEPMYLVPTAEVPVTNFVRDEILAADELPMKFVAHTPCFRSEAGSYGKDTRGIFRQHQFEKVELVHVASPDDSWDAFEELLGNAEAILKMLELPYRASVLCGGDLGFAAAKTVDLEVWLPSQKRYREISSVSNFLDFQARRAQARFRRRAGERPELVHTLNGSGLAVGRALIALMENYQNGDGSFCIPDVLRDYMGGVDSLKLVAPLSD